MRRYIFNAGDVYLQIEGLNTYVVKVSLECPNCQTIFEAQAPDNLHFAYSFERPIKGSYNGEIIQQTLVCQNPQCRAKIALYWYTPRDYFNQI